MGGDGEFVSASASHFTATAMANFWPLLGPTRLEARGSRGAQGDGEQGAQQWSPSNVRRCRRHNTRVAYGQGRSPSLEQTLRTYLHFFNCFSCVAAVFLTPGLKSNPYGR